MVRTLSTTVTEVYSGMRIDSFLFEGGYYPSRSKAVKQIEAEKVYINGSIPSKKTLVNQGDFIVYEELEEDKQTVIDPEDIPLDIFFEDENLIVLNKQANLVCHPSVGHSRGTLCNALVYRYGNENLSHTQGEDRPGIVHRLDGDTTGLMLCAKNDEVGYLLQDEIRSRNVNRRYLCLVHGNIARDTGLIDAPIFRSDKNRLRMQVSDKPQARSSVTTFSVLERFESGLKDNGFTLLECKLYSGRTHQIRVHMEYINHWCVGDPLYGTPGKSDNLGLQRQFLHSYFIEFTHPQTKSELSFLAPLSRDLQKVLSNLFNRRMGLTERGKEVLKSYSLVTLAQHNNQRLSCRSGNLVSDIKSLPQDIKDQAQQLDSFASASFL